MIFWDFLMFYQFFLSPQVKRSVIISNKHGVHELPHELPDNLKLRISGNKENLGKSQNLLELQTSAKTISQNEIFFNASKNSRKIDIEPFP